jgi:hypothetical protein
MTLPITSKYIGVTTIGGHVARALDFASRNDVWVTLGKRDPWLSGTDPLNNNAPVDDQHPPLPDPLTTFATLLDPRVAKKAVLQLVVPDDINGGITAYAKKWRPVTPAEAQQVGGRWVYVYASFDYNEAPIKYADSYVISAVSAGSSVISMFSVSGYMQNDQVMVGLGSTPTRIVAIDPINKTLTLQDPLAFDIPGGTYVVNLDSGSAFTYRQIGVISHATTSIAPSSPGQQLIPATYLLSGLLEYIYNTAPVPRALNWRTEAKLILTF